MLRRLALCGLLFFCGWLFVSGKTDSRQAVSDNRNEVVFVVNGTPDKVVAADESGHVAPYTPDVPCAGRTFCGWTAEPVDMQPSAPEYIDFATAVFDAEQTEVYAVFATCHKGALTDLVFEAEREDFNECHPATSYSDEVRTLETACGLKWQYAYGCPSSTGSSVFFNSTVGFRLQQQSTTSGEMYLELLTPIDDLEKVTFIAGRNASAVEAYVSYLEDNNWVEAQPLSMVTTRGTLNTLQLPSPLTTRIRIRISTLGSKSNYLYLDDFVFYARQRNLTFSDFSASCQLATSETASLVQNSGTPQKIILDGRLVIITGGTARDILGRPVHKSATLALPLGYPCATLALPLGYP